MPPVLSQRAREYRMHKEYRIEIKSKKGNELINCHVPKQVGKVGVQTASKLVFDSQLEEDAPTK